MTKRDSSWRRVFFTILAGQAVSLITSAILQMAIVFYLTEKTGSAMVLSLASLAGFLPYALVGPMIGVLVDRYERKLVMVGADLVIAAAGAALAIIASCMEPPVWLIMGVLCIRSIGNAFHSPAFSAVTPLLVPEKHLVRYAGYNQSIQSLSYIISPAVAALLYSKWHLNAIIALDVAGAVIACIAVMLVDVPELDLERPNARRNLLGEMREGLRVLRGDRGLFALLLIGALYMLVYMPINALFPLISMGYFAGTPMHASIAEIAYASGMLGGGLILGLLGGGKRRITLMSVSVLLMGAALTVSGLLPTDAFVVFVVCCAMMGLSVPFYSGIQTALFQERINPEYLGRVFSLTGSVISLCMPVGLILAGVFADKVGVHYWFLLTGLVIIGIAALYPLVPAVRNLNRGPDR